MKISNQNNQIDFINNINSIENWANGKKILSQRVFERRTFTDRINDILQFLIAKADTSFDKVI